MIINKDIIAKEEDKYFIYVSSFFSKNGIVKVYYNPIKSKYKATEYIGANIEPRVLKVSKNIEGIADFLKNDFDKDFLYKEPQTLINDRDKKLHFRVKYYKNGFKDYQVVIPNFCNLLMNASLGDAISFFNKR